jgi:hypothetical protein
MLPASSEQEKVSGMRLLRAPGASIFFDYFKLYRTAVQPLCTGTEWLAFADQPVSKSVIAAV